MNRLKRLREENNITQEELAKRLNLSKGIISLYEKEERMPSLKVLNELSEIFNCSIDYILGKSDYKNEDDYMDKNTDEMLKVAENVEEILKIYPEFEPNSIIDKMLDLHKKNQNHMIFLNNELEKYPSNIREKIKQVILVLYNIAIFSKDSNTIKIDEDMISIGLSTKDYNPPTKEQQEKIKEFAKFVLKDNLKKKED